MTSVTQYIIPFLMGGGTVAGVKLLSTIMSPVYAAILGALPIGFISVYFIEDIKKHRPYLTNLALQVVCIIISSLAYMHMLNIDIDITHGFIFGFIIFMILTFFRVKFLTTK